MHSFSFCCWCSYIGRRTWANFILCGVKFMEEMFVVLGELLGLPLHFTRILKWPSTQRASALTICKGIRLKLTKLLFPFEVLQLLFGCARRRKSFDPFISQRITLAKPQEVYLFRFRRLLHHGWYPFLIQSFAPHAEVQSLRWSAYVPLMAHLNSLSAANKSFEFHDA